MDAPTLRLMTPQGALASTSKRTLDTWAMIYTFIETHGFADASDDELHKYTSLKPATLRRHLRRMRELDLIDGHEMRRKADSGSIALSYMSFFQHGLPPTRFIRYTLPGKDAPLHVKSIDAIWDSLTDALADPEIMAHVTGESLSAEKKKGPQPET